MKRSIAREMAIAFSKAVAVGVFAAALGIIAVQNGIGDTPFNQQRPDTLTVNPEAPKK